MDNLDFTQDNNKLSGADKYLNNRGIYSLRVVSYVNSQEIEGYNKTPYVKFSAHDEETLKEVSFTFWLPKNKTDSSSRAKTQRIMIKKYLKNLGCDIDTVKGKDLLNCAVGKCCKVALREKEIIWYRKSDKKPTIGTELEYHCSTPSDKTIKVEESKMLFTLTPTKRLEYTNVLAEWEKQNPDLVQKNLNINNMAGTDNDDLPF
jgi:hypothetical protein